MKTENRLHEIDKQISELKEERNKLEKDLKKSKSGEKVAKFLSGHNGQRLLEKYSMDQEGLWKVRGEDPNCDFGGFHHMPELGIYKGTLRDVIAEAVILPGFFQWGSGGDIERLDTDIIEL